MTVSDVDEPVMISTLSLLISWAVTSDARFGFDWLSLVMISTLYFWPPTVIPSAKALRTPAATHCDGSPNAAIGPVSGVTMPILMVLPAARDDWNIQGDAMALAPPAAMSLTTLRRWLSTLSLRFAFTPHFIFMFNASLVIVNV